MLSGGGGGIPPIVGYAGRLCPKRVPFCTFSIQKGRGICFFSILKGYQNTPLIL